MRSPISARVGGVIAVVAVTTGVALAIPSDAAGSLTMLGADVSTAQRSLDLGARYYSASGSQGNPLDILKGVGVNYVRLRIWNNPASGYNNLAKVLVQARAAKAKGLQVMIDFHYSDTWADPGKQYKPAAWSSHGIGALQSDVYNYTLSVCNALKAQGTTPDNDPGSSVGLAYQFEY